MRTYCKYFSTLPPPTRCHYRKKADISIRPFYVLLLLKMLIHIQPDSNQVRFSFSLKNFLILYRNALLHTRLPRYTLDSQKTVLYGNQTALLIL